jgi:hypothetical protein
LKDKDGLLNLETNVTVNFNLKVHMIKEDELTGNFSTWKI